METEEVLAHFGLTVADRIGGGNEASVYALDEQRVVRVPKGPTPGPDHRRDVLDLVAAGAGHLPFAVPTILDAVEVGGRHVHVEWRLEGTSMWDALAGAPDALVTNWLDAVASLKTIDIGSGPWGHLWPGWGAQTATWQEYLGEEPPDGVEPALVHMDAFPGNVLCAGTTITAIVDFSPLTIRGDARLDPLSGVEFLHPRITPNATDRHRAVAREWLGDDPVHEQYRPWIRRWWRFAADDPNVAAWLADVEI